MAGIFFYLSDESRIASCWFASRSSHKCQSGELDSSGASPSFMRPAAARLKPCPFKPIYEMASGRSLVSLTLKRLQCKHKTRRLHHIVALVRAVNVGNRYQHQRNKEGQHNHLQHVETKARHSEEA